MPSLQSSQQPDGKLEICEWWWVSWWWWRVLRYGGPYGKRGLGALQPVSMKGDGGKGWAANSSDLIGAEDCKGWYLPKKSPVEEDVWVRYRKIPLTNYKGALLDGDM